MTEKTLIDHIPAIWIEPEEKSGPRKLAIWLPGFTGCKEEMEPYLCELSARGFFALSFDPWQHGERAAEDKESLSKRVFGNYRRHMWPIFGHTALEILRVIDWAVREQHVEKEIRLGGVSMGGVAAVAAAGIDTRIVCAAVSGSSPDWLRNGADTPPGEPDSYAQYFYNRLNPLTHPDHYLHQPALDFEFGAGDRHVPPDTARQFRDALKETYRAHPDRLRVTLHPGVEHATTQGMWQNCLEWICAH
ncbi:MAG: prolyl oligopeptidase family serine peptidase [Anaerolineales bacterium]|nr:prolyl oligopeptidase family serine peptidase [Anaerolineales bacterium]